MKYETELDLSFNNTMTIFIDQIKPGSTVLEFGPASGRLTRYLKNEKNCEVYIVELDEEAGKIAAEAAKDYIIGDILDYEWVTKFAGVEFDYILFADVLEHLTDAVGVLKQCSKMLSKEGKICLSVPNIAHNSVIINMLRNKFKYVSTGIMDNTHVHFYTKENVEELVEACGMYVEKKYATYTQVGLNEFDNSYNDVFGELQCYLKSRPLGEVYQYVYVISNNKAAVAEDYITEYADYLYAQSFLDGSGAYEEYMKYMLKSDCQIFDFVVENTGAANKLRFDPANTECVVKLLEAKGLKGDVETNLELESTNAFVVKDNMYVFCNDDGQMHFMLDKRDYDRVVIKLEYLKLWSKDKGLDETFEGLKQMENSLLNRISELENEKEQLQQEYEVLREDDEFRKAFISKKPVEGLYKLYNKKNGREFK